MTSTAITGIKKYMNKTTKHFVENYEHGNANPQKLAILATGGGVGLGEIAKIPGASRILNSFQVPYDTEETLRFLRTWHPHKVDEFSFEHSAVSPAAALELYRAMEARYPTCRVIAVTAACMTTRWRRGEDRAYIACKNSEGVVQVWHLKIPKASEEEHKALDFDTLCAAREMQDTGISNVAMMILINHTPTLQGILENGTLSVCYP